MSITDDAAALEDNLRACSQQDLWADWFIQAESFMDAQWADTIWPRIQGVDFTTTVEIGPGGGRNSERLKDLASTLYLVDLNEYALETCRKRFATYGGACDIKYIKTDGVSLPGIEDASVSFVYSWDSMVHFDRTVMDRYVAEFARVMKPGARGFVHHSNYGARDVVLGIGEAPHFRSNMSKVDFALQANRHGLLVPCQELVDWVDDRALDCISFFYKPVP